MATIDTLCALVELETIEEQPGDGPHLRKRDVIKRIVRTYEGEARAAEDLELLSDANPAIRYRIEQITHIER